MLSLDYARTLLTTGDAQAGRIGSCEGFRPARKLPAVGCGFWPKRPSNWAKKANRMSIWANKYLAFQGQTREAITQMNYALKEVDLDADDRAAAERRRKALLEQLRKDRDR